MKRKNSMIRHNGYLMHIIAGVLIICMLFADASLYYVLSTSDELPSANKDDYDNSPDIVSVGDYEIIENHVMEKALADGKFGGENSQSEQESSGTLNQKSEGISINIYEIVAEQGNGCFGYLIGGCEPIVPTVSAFDEKKIEEYKTQTQIYMDAVCNLYPGSNNNKPYKFDSLDQEGVKHFGIKKNSTVNGYYERVESGTGVYSYVSATDNLSNVEMKSKATGEDGNYDFVWHYGNPGDPKKVITKKSDITNMPVGSFIHLKQYVKNEYRNNESFLTLYYSAGRQDTNSGESLKRLNYGGSSVDGTHGLYEIENTDERPIWKEYESNKKVVDSWKTVNSVNYFVRTPSQLSNNDIDNADLIIFNPGADYIKNNYVKLYNNMNRTTHKGKTDYDEDITYEQALKIYDHVAIRQDVAIAMCKTNYQSLRNSNMNIGKLQWLLYAPTANDDSHWGSGREVCREIIKEFNEPNPSAAYADVQLTQYSLKRTNGGSWEWWKVEDWLNDNGMNKMMVEGMEGKYNTNVTGIDKQMDQGQYKNMMIFQQNTQLTYSSHFADSITNMFKNHVEAKHSKTTPEPYYLSMDILNGDSKPIGSISNATNKVLYVNEYELKPLSGTPVTGKHYTEEIPIHIRISSSHDIQSVKVYKNATINPATKTVNTGAVLLYEYSTSEKLDSLLTYKKDNVKKTVTDKKTGVASEINTTEYEDATRDEDGKVVDNSITIKIKDTDLKKTGTSSYALNTSIVVEVTNKAGKSVADSLKIVKRDFFMLN